jgi:glyoxalase family protein
MGQSVLGLHHVTAISSDPQQTLDFYTQVLGLRLIKLTVNFDDPSTYHLYFGDEIGRPGTILTFFPWPSQPPGRKGSGQLTVTSFSVPGESLGFWKERLVSNEITVKNAGERFGETVLSLADRDGQGLELISSGSSDKRKGWTKGPIPAHYAIRGFHSVTLSEQVLETTESVLVDTLGFKMVGEEKNRFRYQVGGASPGAIVDVVSEPRLPRGFVSVGTVHHVAFRVKDDEAQKSLRQEIVNADLNVTPVIDRLYFHSIYFREPGGVLFEAATDPPGFTVDEPVEHLGSGLKLPPRLEPSRAEIEKRLPPVKAPTSIPA